MWLKRCVFNMVLHVSLTSIPFSIILLHKTSTYFALLAVLLFAYCISLPLLCYSVSFFVNIHILFFFSQSILFLAVSVCIHVTLSVFIIVLYLLICCLIFLNSFAFILFSCCCLWFIHFLERLIFTAYKLHNGKW